MPTEDLYPEKVKERDNYPFVHSSFDRNLIRFNLSDFQSGNMEEGKRKNYDMLNVQQISSTVDSLSKNFVEAQNPI
ncbi:MAG: hypothetical protein U5L96_05060 [Owenweeksia sp.]|nr:hypothetical protein [Owenweeksia sp.]